MGLAKFLDGCDDRNGVLSFDWCVNSLLIIQCYASAHSRLLHNAHSRSTFA